jgi:hypothetical protein
MSSANHVSLLKVPFKRSVSEKHGRNLAAPFQKDINNVPQFSSETNAPLNYNNYHFTPLERESDISFDKVHLILLI